MVVGATNVESPGEIAGDGVECAHDAGRLPDLLPVRYPAAQYQAPAHQGGGRRNEIIALVHLAQPCLQVDLSAAPETWAGPPGRGIQRDQPRVERGGKDAFGAGPRCAGHAIIGYAPAHQAIDPGQIRLGIMPPQLPPDFRVQRDNVIIARAQEQAVADLDRVDLKGCALFAVAHLAGAIGPGRLEVADIGRADLFQRGIARSASVVAIGDPVTIGRTGGGRTPYPTRRGRRAIGPERQADTCPYDQRQRGPQHAFARQRGGSPDVAPIIGGQHIEAKAQRHGQARGQRPSVQPYLPQGPGEVRRQKSPEQSDRQRSPAPAQQRDGDHDQSGRKIPRRSAQQQQPPAKPDKAKPGHGKQDQEGGIEEALHEGTLAHGGREEGDGCDQAGSCAASQSGTFMR